MPLEQPGLHLADLPSLRRDDVLAKLMEFLMQASSTHISAIMIAMA